MSVARVAAHRHRDVVSTTPGRGTASEAPAAPESVVSASHQTKDVKLDEEAARASKPATADETLSWVDSSAYLTGIGAKTRADFLAILRPLHASARRKC